ncbi:MAG: site-2 protease family protein [Candidatus Giovannonibacteria bacterium]|nr:site-2 protease family protein [Candidatus Giovannonibacteria bacterium]
MLLTFFIFLIILLVLVLSHEAGHFFTARFFGVKVEEFGFGIPPRILSLWRDAKGTLYSLNLLPFGGFVKIFGEDLPAGEAGGNEVSQPGSFGSKSAPKRAVILASGVLANILLAFLALTLVSGLGVPQAVSEEESSAYPDAKITIMDVAPDSPAARAGIMPGDQISGFQKMENVQDFIKQNQGKNIPLSLIRGGKLFEISALSRQNPPEGEGPLGIALGLTRVKKSPWYLAPADGARFTWEILKGTILGLLDLIQSLFKKEALPVEVAGPVGIFNITSSAINLGFGTLLILIAVLSVNLALINILPFPGLDGGRLFFILIESLRGKRISPKTSALVHSLGLAILIILMLIVTYHDIARIF